MQGKIAFIGVVISLNVKLYINVKALTFHILMDEQFTQC